MKTEAQFNNFLIAILTLMGVLALAGLLASCRLLEKPDAFDQMFEAAAQQNVMRMQNPPPLGVQKTWRDWQAQ